MRMAKVVVGLCLLAVASARARQAAPAPPAEPVTYTEEQAGRGEAVFTRVCLECHARKEMANPDFRVKWNGRTMFDLVDRIRNSMPESNPGGLPRNEYVDVAAYLAKLNGLTAGSTALPDDDTVLKRQVLTLPAGRSPRRSVDTIEPLWRRLPFV